MTPLVLIVGFLGSGKTSLMRELVPSLAERGLRPHVILNDFQNASVDATYFESLAETVAPINGSCVCCESFEELIGVLEAQRLDERSIVLLESNGVTDSIGLIEQLSLRPECARYTMPVQISVVDAKRWQQRSWHNNLEREQVTTARFVRLTWQDVADEKRISEVRASLGEIVPEAELLALDELADALEATQEESRDWPPRRLTERMEGETHHHHHDDEHDHDHEHEHGHVHDHGRYHFASWEHPLPPEVDPRVFFETMNDLPPEVLRCKGVVRLAEPERRRLLFQKVGEDDLMASALPDERGIEPMIIFIGASLPVDDLRARVERLKEAGASAAT
ncbi:MAG: GTP-binding protein [Verrucomicrobiota bacterium]